MLEAYCQLQSMCNFMQRHPQLNPKVSAPFPTMGSPGLVSRWNSIPSESYRARRLRTCGNRSQDSPFIGADEDDMIEVARPTGRLSIAKLSPEIDISPSSTVSDRC